MSIAEEINALRHLDFPALVKRYREVFGREPAATSRELLWKEIAWRIQADRAAEDAARVGAPARAEIKFTIATAAKADVPQRRKPDEPPVGTIIVRRWRGRELRVQVTDEGFVYEGVVYGSLSAVAKAITGVHWNGRLFFGLRGRTKRR